MTGQTKSINCTNCGAGLDVLGGGRVVTQVCTYCGAALDATDAFRVIEVFGNMLRPDSPFRLGMQGEVQGVLFTIIGTLGQRETYRGQTWNWVDHQLYSPTHGYAWLTVEDGHTLLTRKVRDLPQGSFLTSSTVESSENAPSRTWRGTNYRYYASSRWETVFVEGEFNWRPAKGATGDTVSLMPSGRAREMIHFVENHRNGTATGEREVEVTSYWPEAAAAFGIDPLAPRAVHPLQPYRPDPTGATTGYFFGALATIAAVLALLFWSMKPAGVQLLADDTAVPPEIAFDIADASRPAEVEFYERVDNSFVDYDITLTDPSGEVLAETYRGISYYSGGVGEDSWTEGSRRTSLGFMPTDAGRYTLTVNAEAEPSFLGSRAEMPRITLRTGQTNPLWLLAAAGLFGLAFLWHASARMRHVRNRWADSDWSDD